MQNKKYTEHKRNDFFFFCSIMNIILPRKSHKITFAGARKGMRTCFGAHVFYIYISLEWIFIFFCSRMEVEPTKTIFVSILFHRVTLKIFMENLSESDYFFFLFYHQNTVIELLTLFTANRHFLVFDKT